MSTRPIVVFAGYLVRYPLGGYAWQVVHYLTGLREAGCDVYFYEDTRHYRDAYDPQTGETGTDYANGIAFARRLLAEAGFADRWVFYDSLRGSYSGLDEDRTRALLADATILINAAGVNRFSENERRGKTVLYIDMDPAYTQIRLSQGDPILGDLLDEHDLHFSFGESIGTSRCLIPTGRYHWRATRQPVALDSWHSQAPPHEAPFTTIGKWDSGGRDVILNGERYTWRKRLEWARIMGLPGATGARFLLAMDVVEPGDRAELECAGWQLQDPLEISRDISAYRAFIQASRAEFTTAKDVNVRLQSGWFSDRSACYLAAGRPVVTQDTGFGAHLPTGVGLYAFRTLEEAAVAVRNILADPEASSAAALAIAREHFDAKRVCEHLLAAV